jgi:hypothetical protein
MHVIDIILLIVFIRRNLATSEVIVKISGDFAVAVYRCVLNDDNSNTYDGVEEMNRWHTLYVKITEKIDLRCTSPVVQHYFSIYHHNSTYLKSQHSWNKIIVSYRLIAVPPIKCCDSLLD